MEDVEGRNQEHVGAEENPYRAVESWLRTGKNSDTKLVVLSDEAERLETMGLWASTEDKVERKNAEERSSALADTVRSHMDLPGYSDYEQELAVLSVPITNHEANTARKSGDPHYEGKGRIAAAEKLRALVKAGTDTSSS